MRRGDLAPSILFLALALAACGTTRIHTPASAEPGEQGFGAQVHTMSLGLAVMSVTATGIVASAPTDAGPRQDGTWRTYDMGRRLAYCEGGAATSCQAVAVGGHVRRPFMSGMMILVDPVNLANVLVQTSSPQLATTSGELFVGDIDAPYTPQRGLWLVTGAPLELHYCSVDAAGQAGCQPAVGLAPARLGLFQTPTKVLSSHVLTRGDAAHDVAWLVASHQYYRCEAGPDDRVATCTTAESL